MTVTLAKIQFIAPFAPPMKTTAEISLSWGLFCREFPQSPIRRLWARFYFGSNRAAAVTIRVVDKTGNARVGTCLLTWDSQSESCYAVMDIDPSQFKIEPGNQMEILRQTWTMSHSL
jgi:hypothetical protein